MINGISSISSVMTMMQNRPAKNHPSPPDKDIFQATDTDGDGLVSSSELENLLAGLQETTGESLEIDEVLSTYDSDGDNGLSGEEMLALMSEIGLGPRNAGYPPRYGDATMPPPPATTEQALFAYEQNSGYDPVSQLLDLLQDNGSGVASSIEVTT